MQNGIPLFYGRTEFRPPMSNPETAKVWYQCQRCANCCKWPGLVRLTEADISAIAKHLGVAEWDFIQRYTRLRPQRDGLALLDAPTGACIFLEGHACAIQPVKPSQCRGFPNAWNFPGWRDVCEAIAQPLPDAEAVHETATEPE